MQLPGAAGYDSQMAMHTSTTNTDTSLARELETIFKTQHGHMTCWITVMTENFPVNGSGLSVSIMYKTEKMCHIYQLKFHLQQLSYQNFHFAFCMQNLME